MLNEYQQLMFDRAESLAATTDTFYSQDFSLDEKTYRIYNYRLASYTEFMREGGLEMRGHMFEVDSSGAPVRLAALPMQKFFNLNENPMTMGLDLSKVDTVELKADGSLMSSYLHDGKVRFKSKGSLFSEQAIDSIKWAEQPQQADFMCAVRQLEESEYTVNLEWCAPHNRIVIGYLVAHMRVLNARSRLDGSYCSREALVELFGEEPLIQRPNMEGVNVGEFILTIPRMTDDIEGYIGRLGDLWFKCKTEKYMSLHHVKDSINNPRRLFEAVVDEAIDDMRSLFADDQVALALIDAMESRVVKLYNEMVKEVEAFYEANKALSKKDFAIKGQQEVTRMYFSLAMNLYVDRKNDYKQFMKSKYKELGFRDTSLDKTTE